MRLEIKRDPQIARYRLWLANRLRELRKDNKQMAVLLLRRLNHAAEVLRENMSAKLFES